MKEGFVVKTAQNSPSREQMQKISRYSRRELSPGEVYTFSVILCDNEIDRDGERFTIPALKRLAVLFLGRTGIFDHDPKGENQTARIFDAYVVTEPERRTTAGESYTCLKAEAYMVRSPKTEELILEIDAGIKKEVSVGCSVAKAVCSVCGADRRKEGCSHHIGEVYNGVPCHVLLDDPTDAYEWSFVAVPAQRAAGVVKEHGMGGSVRSGEELLKCFASSGQELMISEPEQKELCRTVEELRRKAYLGDVYTQELRQEIIRLSCMTDQPAQVEVTKQIVERMKDTESLKALRDAYRERWNSTAPEPPQLSAQVQTTPDDKQDYMI